MGANHLVRNTPEPLIAPETTPDCGITPEPLTPYISDIRLRVWGGGKGKDHVETGRARSWTAAGPPHFFALIFSNISRAIFIASAFCSEVISCSRIGRNFFAASVPCAPARFNQTWA